MTEEETSVPPAEAPEVVPAEKSMEQDLKEKVGAGAQVLGSFFGSAWSKAAEGAAFFSFATGPDDGEEEPLDPKDLSESPKKEKKAEIEDPEDEETDPLSYFLSAAMCKVGLTQSGSKDELKASESSYSLVDSAYSVFEKAKKTLEDNLYDASLFELNTETDESTRKHHEDLRIRNYYKGMFPWLGYEKESELKEKVLALSADKRNFIFDPPEGVSFDFDYSQATGIAEGLLSQDENLQLMRYRIVPKLKSEEAFWRNYFYRVSLIQQCYELKSVEDYVAPEGSSKSLNSPETPNDSPLEELPGEDEFVSEAFQDMDDVKGGGRKAKKPSAKDEEKELEAELENELQEYEVVKDGEEAEDWENQLEEMLDDS